MLLFELKKDVPSLKEKDTFFFFFAQDNFECRLMKHIRLCQRRIHFLSFCSIFNFNWKHSVIKN